MQPVRTTFSFIREWIYDRYDITSTCREVPVLKREMMETVSELHPLLMPVSVSMVPAYTYSWVSKSGPLYI